MAKEQYTIDVFHECIGQYKDKDIVFVLFIALKHWKILMIHFWRFSINAILLFFKLWFFKGNLKIKYNEREWSIFCNVIKVTKSHNFHYKKK